MKALYIEAFYLPSLYICKVSTKLPFKFPFSMLWQNILSTNVRNDVHRLYQKRSPRFLQLLQSIVIFLLELFYRNCFAFFTSISMVASDYRVEIIFEIWFLSSHFFNICASICHRKSRDVRYWQDTRPCFPISAFRI